MNQNQLAIPFIPPCLLLGLIREPLLPILAFRPPRTPFGAAQTYTVCWLRFLSRAIFHLVPTTAFRWSCACISHTGKTHHASSCESCIFFLQQSPNCKCCISWVMILSKKNWTYCTNLTLVTCRHPAWSCELLWSAFPVCSASHTCCHA